MLRLEYDVMKGRFYFVKTRFLLGPKIVVPVYEPNNPELVLYDLDDIRALPETCEVERETKVNLMKLYEFDLPFDYVYNIVYNRLGRETNIRDITMKNYVLDKLLRLVIEKETGKKINEARKQSHIIDGDMF